MRRFSVHFCADDGGFVMHFVRYIITRIVGNIHILHLKSLSKYREVTTIFMPGDHFYFEFIASMFLSALIDIHRNTPIHFFLSLSFSPFHFITHFFYSSFFRWSTNESITVLFVANLCRKSKCVRFTIISL